MEVELKKIITWIRDEGSHRADKGKITAPMLRTRDYNLNVGTVIPPNKRERRNHKWKKKRENAVRNTLQPIFPIRAYPQFQ